MDGNKGGNYRIRIEKGIRWTPPSRPTRLSETTEDDDNEEIYIFRILFQSPAASVTAARQNRVAILGHIKQEETHQTN